MTFNSFVSLVRSYLSLLANGILSIQFSCIGEHKTPEFQKISPHGEVPVLVDGDVTVYGAVPILLYLGEKYTDFNRFGDTLKEKIKVRLAFINRLEKCCPSCLIRKVAEMFPDWYMFWRRMTETVVHTCSIKKGVLKNFA